MVERTVAGRYDLLTRLGRGGMGEVWAAHDRVIGRRVAVKLLRHETDTPGAVELFFREARTAGSLDHPGIVTVFDLGQDPADGTLYLVALVEGRDLGVVLARDGPPGVREAIEWTAQAADTLAAAHTAGIVHRDLKPANLMRGPRDRIKVLDFGLDSGIAKPPVVV